MLQRPDLSTPADETIPALGKPRRLRLVVLGAVALILLFVGGIAALAWQATHGSVNLGFLRGRIEDAVRARLPADADVAIGAAGVSYDGDRGLLLKARAIQLDLPGAASIKAAEIATVASPSTLFGGRLDLRSVTVSGVEVAVAIRPSPRGGEGSVADRLRSAAGGFAGQLLEADSVLRGAGLQEVLVRDARVFAAAEAAAKGPALTISEASWRPVDSNRSEARLRVAERGGDGWDLIIGREGRDEAEAAVTLAVEGLPVAALAPNLAADDGGPFFQSTLRLQTRIDVDASGTAARVQGVLSSADGLVSITGRDRIALQSAALNFALGSEGERIELPYAEIRTPTGAAELAGFVDLSGPDGMILVGDVQQGVLPVGGSGPPVPLTGGGVRIRFDPASLSVDIERLDLAAADGMAAIAGQARFVGAAPGLSLELSLSEMPARTLRAFWPPFVAAKTRGWFDASVRSGRIGPARLQIELPLEQIGPAGRDKVLPPDALSGSLPFQDAEFTPLKTFPPLRQAAGEVAFANATATVQTWAGSLDIPGKGAVQAGGSGLTIPQLGRLRLRGDLRLVLSGPASALAVLSNTQPFSIAAKRGILPDALSGDAELSLDANIPLDGGNLAEAESSFRLALADFSSTSPIDGRVIGDADLILEGGPKSFTVKGEGTLDGLEASVDLILGSGSPEQTDVSLMLDDAARKRLGLGFGGVVTGPVQAAVKGSVAEGQTIALDMKETRISLPMLGWEKGPGVPATAHFSMRKSEAGVEISDLLLSGKGFKAKGALSIGADGKLRNLKLEELALRAGDNLSAEVTPSGGGYEARIRGSSLDARGIIRGVKSGFGDGKAGAGRIQVSLDLDEVAGLGDVVLSDVSGTLHLNSQGLDRAALKGSAAGGAAFEWTLGKEGDARTLRLVADNGGALVRFVGLYDKVVGGNLVLDYSGAAGGAGSGALVMRDFRLHDEKALAPAVERARQAANDRAIQRPEAASGDLSFSQLRIPFRQEGWVITIDDAALRGPMIGATASGTINVPGGKMAISGTFIPAFGINNIAGAIPILGTILGGGRDEGLLGITYKLFGPLDDPKLAMNPVSAIAPGIFRKIFEYR